MPKAGKFYAVRKGRVTGIYNTWEACKEQVHQFPKAEYKSFSVRNDAMKYLRLHGKDYHELIKENTNREVGPKRTQVSAKACEVKKDPLEQEQERLSMAIGRPTFIQQIYTDGSCIGNHNDRSLNKAGYGVFFGHNDPRNAWGPIRNGSNNVGELEAIRQAVSAIKYEVEAMRGKPPGYNICSDSQYALNCVLKWPANWKIENGVWKTKGGEDVQNSEIIRDIRSHMQYFHEKKYFVLLSKVKGHSGNPGNEAADRLANQGSASERPTLSSFLQTPIPKIDTDKTKYIFTDGFMITSDREKTGYGVHFSDKTVAKDICGSVPQAIEESAQLVAVERALDTVKALPKNSQYTIVTNKQHTIDLFTTLSDQWESQEWLGSDSQFVGNMTILQTIRSNILECESLGYQIKFVCAKEEKYKDHLQFATRLARAGAYVEIR